MLFLLPGQAKGLFTVCHEWPCLSIEKGRPLKQQIAQHTYTVPRRASALPPPYRTEPPPAHHTRTTQTPRNVGVYDPYTRTRTRNQYNIPSSSEWIDEEEDEPVYQTRPPRSAVVYRRPYTHVEPVIRTEDLPDQRPRRGLHPLVYIGISMLIAVIFITAYIYIPPAWQRHVDDVTYGYPRTFQTDANVGHGGVSHFIVLNLHGTIEVIEVPPNPTRNQPRLYLITQFGNPGADLLPATVSFTDLNSDGKPDMQVTVYNGSNPTIYILFNDGTTFKPHL